MTFVKSSILQFKFWECDIKEYLQSENYLFDVNLA